MRQSKVYIVIVTYNAMTWVESCLKSLRESDYPVNVIVIDNNSTDETVDYIINKYKEVEVVPLNYNAGFGKANNIGIKKAYEKGAEYVYLLNQDAWIMPDTIEKLINAVEANSSIGIASPIHLDATKKSVDRLFLKHITMRQGDTREILNDYLSENKKSLYYIGFFPAAHWLISRRCIEDVGLFSPAFYHYGEDNNYIQRTHYHKFKTAIIPDAFAVHDRGARKKYNAIGLLFLQYKRATVEASNIEIGLVKHELYCAKYVVFVFFYYLMMNVLRLFNFEIKGYYLQITPIWVIRRYYKLTKNKGFMLS